MSANPRAFRKIIFDAGLFSYTFMVLAYAVLFLCAPVYLENIPLDQEFFLAQMDRLLAIALGIVVFSAVLALISHRLHWRTAGWSLFHIRSSQQENIQASRLSFTALHLIFLFLMSLAIALQITEASLFELLDREGLQGAWRLWTGLTHPNFSILAKAVLKAVETIYIAFLATVFAVPVAFCLAFFCAKNLMATPLARALYAALRLVLNTTRSVEPLIWALIFTVWVGVGPFAGMLALMIHSVASLTKYYSEIIESVNEGPVDAVRSTGARPIQVVWFAVVPQVILPYIAMTLYLWDTNVRMATVIGLVGGGGIGTLLIQYQGQAMWPEVGCIILVIAAIVWVMDVASAYIREALK